MPYKDPERKKEWSKRWRKASIANGYGRWLYQRRTLRYADADYFREALEEIEATADYTNAQVIAQHALKQSKERWEALGPSPETSVGTERKRKPVKPDDTLHEALARLNLE